MALQNKKETLNLQMVSERVLSTVTCTGDTTGRRLELGLSSPPPRLGWEE